MVCDGTTLSSFIHKWLDIDLANYYEAKSNFIHTYLMLKEFELFQRTRYTNPDIEFGRAGDAPKCVYVAFEEYFENGDTKFNRNRMLQRIRNDNMRQAGLGFDNLTTKNA